MIGKHKYPEGPSSRLLSEADWRALVDQLSALRLGDFESAVMAVRMRRRKRLNGAPNLNPGLL